MNCVKDINSNQRKSLFIFCSSNVLWMYLKMCALYIIYALKISLPVVPSPSVGNNLVFHSFQSSESSGIIPCFSRTSETVKSSSCKDPACWLIQLRGNCTNHLKFSDGKLSSSIVLSDFLRTFEITHSCIMMFIIAYLLRFYECLPQKWSLICWPCLHMGTNSIHFSEH